MRLADRIKEGGTTFGTFLNMGSPIAAECAAIAGMDYVIVDLEHSQFSLNEAVECIRAASLRGASPLVRVSEISRSLILRLLDAGADGIVVPAIRTVEEAKKLVEFGKYRPLGNRGFCPTRAASFGYGSEFGEGILAYVEKANRDTMLIAQCETLECLESIDEIVALDGIDGIFIGPFDLSLAMGIPAMFDKSEFKAALEKVKSACKAQGKPVFIFAPNAQAAALRLSEGYDSITINGDLNVMTESYISILKGLKA